jgi:hypothetical protein
VTDEIEVLRLFRDDMPGPSTDAWTRARSAIAVARAEEEQAGRRHSRGPGRQGPARRGPGRQGPGRRKVFSMAAGIAMAAAVAGLLAVLLPNSPATGGHGKAASAQQIRTTAYVITRVEHALSLSGRDNVLGYARTVYPPGTVAEPAADVVRVQLEPGASSPWSVGSMVRWSYQGTMSLSAVSPTGKRVFARGTTVAHGKPATVVVIYRDATWWRPAGGAAPARNAGAPSSCGPDVTIGPGGWPAFIREELSCGEYMTAGRQLVDGMDAIKITGNKGLDTLWVNPATYLPARAIFTFGRLRTQTDFRWLPPTPANLARLSVRVPAGFRQVPPPS